MNPFDKYLKKEDHLHIQVCRYIKFQYPSVIIHHSPNEGKRTPFERYLLNLLQVAPGWPDLFLLYPKKKKAIAIELKAGKNKPTKNQLNFIENLAAIGVPATWANTFEDAKNFIDDHFK